MLRAMQCTLLKRMVAQQPSSILLQRSVRCAQIHIGLLQTSLQGSTTTLFQVSAPATNGAGLPSVYHRGFSTLSQELCYLQKLCHHVTSVSLPIPASSIKRFSSCNQDVGPRMWRKLQTLSWQAPLQKLGRPLQISHATSALKGAAGLVEVKGGGRNSPLILTITRGGEEEKISRKSDGAERKPVGSWEVATPGALEEHLLYYRSFYDLFVEHSRRASDSLWGKGEGPLSDMEGHLSWLAPDLGPSAQELQQSPSGTELFGFMVCFPDSPEAFRAMSEMMVSVFLVDDWVEQQGPDSAAQLAEWWGMIATQSEIGANFNAHHALVTFPPALAADPSLHMAGGCCCFALTIFHQSAAQSDPAWFGRFARASQEYAEAVASEVEAAQVFRKTGVHPPVSEYFAYRCFSSAFIQLAVLAALQQGLRISDARFAHARPLLVCASLVACCFNDAFVAAKDAAAGQANLVKVVGRRRAVEIHNTLVDCLCEEATEWLGSASEGDDSERFVNLLKASTFGCNLWHNICPRYREYLEVTRQPFGLVEGPNGLLSARNGALKREMKELVHDLVLN